MISPVIAKIVSLQSSLTVSENEIAQYVIHNPDAVVSSTITAIAQQWAMISPVIAKIVSLQSSLTVSENEIAQYVIHNPDAVVSSTITAIAQQTNTSEASINRFCKKIGFKGFNSFKVALAQDNFYSTMQKSDHTGYDSFIGSISRDYINMLTNTTALLDEDFKVALAQDNFYSTMQKSDHTGYDSFIGSISRDYINMLTNTTALLDEDEIFRAADAIRRARHVYIFASPTTAMVAHELQIKLDMAGLYAKAITDAGQIQIYASNVTGEDLVIAIAPTLLMRSFYRAIELCKDLGATLISISSYDSPKLSSLIDYKFIISDKITTRYSVSISNSLTFLYVADVLYCALLERDKGKLSSLIDYKFIISDKITTRYSVSISNSLTFLYVADVLYCALLERDKGLKQHRLDSDSRINSVQRMDPYLFEY